MARSNGARERSGYDYIAALGIGVGAGSPGMSRRKSSPVNLKACYSSAHNEDMRDEDRRSHLNVIEFYKALTLPGYLQQ